MAKKIVVINQTRPRIQSQGVVSLAEMAARVSPNTTYNKIEVHSILQLFVEGVIEALEAGESIKIDGLVMISPFLSALRNDVATGIHFKIDIQAPRLNGAARRRPVYMYQAFILSAPFTRRRW